VKNYSAYLFDMDGTLVRSESLKGKALSETCGCFGKQVDVDIYKEVMGESWEIVTSFFFEKGQFKPNRREFDRIFNNSYEKLIHKEVELNLNVKQFLDKIVLHKRKIGLVSSAPRWMVEYVLKKFNMEDYFNVLITKENVKNHKPNPEAYLLALDKLSLSGNKVLVFEDSYAGVKAAKNAGCDVVAFQHEFNIKHDFSLSLQVISDYSKIEI